MSEYVKQFRKNGYTIVKSTLDQEAALDQVQSVFLDFKKNRFTNDLTYNRALIKKFADLPITHSYIRNEELINKVRGIIETPVFTGPVVSHYTSNDFTGNSFGLAYHQDWPSMATSENGIIVWTCLNNCNAESGHNIEIVPQSHHMKPARGSNTKAGYLVDSDLCLNSVKLNIKAGDFLLMDPWLIHKTYIDLAMPDDQFKLSLSYRVDDMACSSWQKRNYVSAYGVVVDRNMWKEIDK